MIIYHFEAGEAEGRGVVVGPNDQSLLPEDELPGGDVPGGHHTPAHPLLEGDQEGETLAPVLMQSLVLVTAETAENNNLLVLALTGAEEVALSIRLCVCDFL